MTAIRALSVPLPLLLTPSTASAHLVTSGVGPFYDGVAHFFVTPEDLLIVVALALLAGLVGKEAGRLLVLILPLAWLAGAIAGRHLDVAPLPPLVLPVGTLLIALLAAINPRLPVALPAVLAAVLGALHGLNNGRAMAETATPVLAAIGIASALGVLALLLAALAASLRTGWQTIAARTVASWIAAIALLALAWQFRS